APPASGGAPATGGWWRRGASRSARRRGTDPGLRAAPRAAALLNGWCLRRPGRPARLANPSPRPTRRTCPRGPERSSPDPPPDEALAERLGATARGQGMEEGPARAEELVGYWNDELQRELPAVDLFDAHVHLGHDIDGMRGEDDELLRIMDDYSFSRAFMFCMDEPDRHPGFRAPNDRTLSFAERSA